MEDENKECRNCKYFNTLRKNFPCIDCLDKDRWEAEEKETKEMPRKKESEISLTKDNINPNHYKNSCSLECIEAMEMAFGWEAVFDFCKCNAWKYIWRWKNKNGEEDLKKALWYLDYVDHFNFYGENRSQISNMKHYIYHELGISEEPCDEQ